MSDKRFWRTMPTVLNALSDVHVEMNTPPSKSDTVTYCEFVDEAPFLI